MKKLFHILCLVFFALFVTLGCSKNDIIPEEEEVQKEETEKLPSDTDPVIGTIDGEIALAEYSESKSTSIVTINRIPHTIEKFLELRAQIAITPQGAAVMMIVAMRIYQQYPVEGMKCLTANCTNPLLASSSEVDSYNGQRMSNISELKRKLTDYIYLPMVYFKGASPSNGYTPIGPPYQAETSVNQYCYTSSTDGSLRIKIFVATQGADSPRPVTVRKVGELYCVTEYSSLYLAPKNLIN